MGGGIFQNCVMTGVTSLIRTPKNIYENTFMQDTYDNVDLGVPSGTADQYARCKGWKKFRNIGGTTPTDYYLYLDTTNISATSSAATRTVNV